MKKKPQARVPGALCVRYGAASMGYVSCGARSGLYEGYENCTPFIHRTHHRSTAWLYAIETVHPSVSCTAVQESRTDAAEEQLDQRLSLRPRVTAPTRRHRERVEHAQKRPCRQHHVELPYRTGLYSRAQE